MSIIVVRYVFPNDGKTKSKKFKIFPTSKPENIVQAMKNGFGLPDHLRLLLTDSDGCDVVIDGTLEASEYFLATEEAPNPGASYSSSPKWACGACTFLNATTDMQCNNCGAPKGDSEPPTGFHHSHPYPHPHHQHHHHQSQHHMHGYPPQHYPSPYSPRSYDPYQQGAWGHTHTPGQGHIHAQAHAHAIHAASHSRNASGTGSRGQSRGHSRTKGSGSHSRNTSTGPGKPPPPPQHDLQHHLHQYPTTRPADPSYYDSANPRDHSVMIRGVESNLLGESQFHIPTAESLANISAEVAQKMMGRRLQDPTLHPLHPTQELTVSNADPVSDPDASNADPVSDTDAGIGQLPAEDKSISIDAFLATTAGAPPRSKLNQVIDEIVETEKLHLQKLRATTKWYIKPMFKPKQAAPLGDAADRIRHKAMSLISNDEKNVLNNSCFKRWPEMEKISTIILAELETGLDRCGNDENLRVAVVAKVFSRFSPFLKLYQVYAGTMAAAQAVIAKISQKSEFKLYKELSSRGTLGQGLDSLLIAPVQRVPRYELLLKEMLKCLVEGCTEDQLYQDLNSAYRGLANTCAEINNNIRDMDNRGKVIALQEKLRTPYALMAASRLFVKEGPMWVVSAKTDVEEPLYFYLFNDLLIGGRFSKPDDQTGGFTERFHLNISTEYRLLAKDCPSPMYHRLFERRSQRVRSPSSYKTWSEQLFAALQDFAAEKNKEEEMKKNKKAPRRKEDDSLYEGYLMMLVQSNGEPNLVTFEDPQPEPEEKTAETTNTDTPETSCTNQDSAAESPKGDSPTTEGNDATDDSESLVEGERSVAEADDAAHDNVNDEDISADTVHPAKEEQTSPESAKTAGGTAETPASTTNDKTTAPTPAIRTVPVSEEIWEKRYLVLSQRPRMTIKLYKYFVDKEPAGIMDLSKGATILPNKDKEYQLPFSMTIRLPGQFNSGDLGYVLSGGPEGEGALIQWRASLGSLCMLNPETIKLLPGPETQPKPREYHCLQLTHGKRERTSLCPRPTNLFLRVKDAESKEDWISVLSKCMSDVSKAAKQRRRSADLLLGREAEA